MSYRVFAEHPEKGLKQIGPVTNRLEKTFAYVQVFAEEMPEYTGDFYLLNTDAGTLSIYSEDVQSPPRWEEIK